MSWLKRLLMRFGSCPYCTYDSSALHLRAHLEWAHASRRSEWATEEGTDGGT